MPEGLLVFKDAQGIQVVQTITVEHIGPKEVCLTVDKGRPLYLNRGDTVQITANVPWKEIFNAFLVRVKKAKRKRG